MRQVEPVADLAPRMFWFLRHGTTARNAARLAQGNVEVPLNEQGRREAQAAASKLIGQEIATIVASPLGRARETAEIVGAALRLPVQLHEGLREAELGPMDNMPMGPWFDDWVEERSTPEGVEAFSDLRCRAVAAVNSCTTYPGPVLLVGHGAFFRALRGAMGLEANIRLPNGIAAQISPPVGDRMSWSLLVL